MLKTVLLVFFAVCKTCIVKYLQSSKNCPQCTLKIHETQPLMNLKPDRVMQDIVYKLVPNLFESKCIVCVLWTSCSYSYISSIADFTTQCK